jgi:hypothetical protein
VPATTFHRIRSLQNDGFLSSMRPLATFNTERKTCMEKALFLSPELPECAMFGEVDLT